MDVSGVGQSPAGYSAVPETALDPQRSGQAGTSEKSGQVRQAPLDLLSDARLGRELVSLGLRPDAAKLMAARALVLQQGSIDLTMLLDVERSLQGMSSAGQPEAEAAAYLVARRLPATSESVSWVLGRQNTSEPAGSRMIAIIQRFAAALQARAEAPSPGPRPEAPVVAPTPQPSKPGAESKPPATAPTNSGGASATPTAASGTPSAAATSATTPPSTAPAPTPAPGANPTPATGTSVPAAPEPEGSMPQGERAPTSSPAAPTSPERPAATPAPATPTPAPSAPSVPAAPQPAVAQGAIATLAAELAEAMTPEGAPEAKLPGSVPADTPKSLPKPPEAMGRELLATLQALALPEGKAKEVANALRRLVHALKPQEADLARGEVAQAKERLTEMATKMLAKAPQDANAREVHDEVRFQQVRSARPEGQEPREFVIPVWWNAGSGEIRVQERPKGAAKRTEEASAPTRVVISLDTPHLGTLRIDLLLAQRQVNCLVAAQDQGAADFLSARLTELRSAIEATGIRVNGLGMKPFTNGTDPVGPGDAKGVDYYG